MSLYAPIIWKPPWFQRSSNTRRRSSSDTSRADCVGATTGTPPNDFRASALISWNFSLCSATTSGASGALFAGRLKFGVRWNT